jgi:hypothetical protein
MLTPKFRVSFPNVFTPALNKLSGKEEYSIVALFGKGQDLTDLKKLAEKTLVEALGADKSKWPKNLKSPFRDQEDMAKDGVLPAGAEAGAMFIRLKSKQKPGVVDANVEPIINAKDFYAGCYARASVNCYYYDHVANKGVAFGLNNIQKLSDGELLGGHRRPEEEFAPIKSNDEESFFS